jgi:hypothetical protein
MTFFPMSPFRSRGVVLIQEAIPSHKEQTRRPMANSAGISAAAHCPPLDASPPPHGTPQQRWCNALAERGHAFASGFRLRHLKRSCVLNESSRRLANPSEWNAVRFDWVGHRHAHAARGHGSQARQRSVELILQVRHTTSVRANWEVRLESSAGPGLKSGCGLPQGT